MKERKKYNERDDENAILNIQSQTASDLKHAMLQ